MSLDNPLLGLLVRPNLYIISVYFLLMSYREGLAAILSTKSFGVQSLHAALLLP